MKGDLEIKLLDGRVIKKRRRFKVIPTETGVAVTTDYIAAEMITPESLTFTVMGLTSLIDDVLGTTCGRDDVATELSMDFKPDSIFIPGSALKLRWNITPSRK